MLHAGIYLVLNVQLQKWPLLKFILWSNWTRWSRVHKKGAGKNEARTASSLLPQQVRAGRWGSCSLIKASSAGASSSPCPAGWAQGRAPTAPRRPLLSSTARGCKRLSGVSLTTARVVLRQSCSSSQWLCKLSVCSSPPESAAQSRALLPCPHWSVPAGRNEPGLHKKSNSRTQPPKTHTLTGTVFAWNTTQASH